MASWVYCALLAYASALRVPETHPIAEKSSATELSWLGGRGLKALDGKVSGAAKVCAKCPALSMLFGERIGAPLKRCALIGSSEELGGRKLGSVINEYDTVIRVNRLPTRDYQADFGNRTDVLFAGAVADAREMFTQQGQFYKRIGEEKKRKLCAYTAACPFRSVILKGVDTMEVNGTFEEHYPVSKPGWKPQKSKFPIARQSQDLNMLAYRLLRWNSSDIDKAGQPLSKRPTTGFQAFLTAALACEALDVFGFAGTGTIDGHKISWRHDLETEHFLMREFVNGSLLDEFKKFLPGCAQCLQSKSRSVRIATWSGAEV